VLLGSRKKSSSSMDGITPKEHIGYTPQHTPLALTKREDKIKVTVILVTSRMVYITTGNNTVCTVTIYALLLMHSQRSDVSMCALSIACFIQPSFCFMLFL